MWSRRAVACVVLILLTVPSLTVAQPAAFPPETPSLDPTLATLLGRWIADGGIAFEGLPTRADAAFEQWTGFSAGPEWPEHQDAWLAYRQAFGIEPDLAETQALAAFERDHPNVAREVARLAGHVAVAETLRAQAFAALAPADLARLPALAAALAAGESPTNDEIALLTLIDFDLLGRAGALLARASQDAPERLSEAGRLDAARALEEAARRDGLAAVRQRTGWPDVANRAPSVAELLGPFASPSKPTETDLLSVLLRAGADNAAAIAATESTPAALRGPVAELLSAALTEDPTETRATLGAYLRLEQAFFAESYRASIETPGRAREARGLARTIGAVSASSPVTVVGPILADAIAAPAQGATPTASFADGLAALHANRGSEPSDVPALDPELDVALGSLLAAIAAYETGFGPDAPSTRALEASREAARRLLEDGVRSGTDAEQLRIAAQEELLYRDLLSESIMSIVESVERLRGATPTGGMRKPTTATGASDVLYRDSFVIITGPGASQHTLEDFDRSPVLLVDLGGDDRYAAPIAGVDAGEPDVNTGHPARLARVSIAIDLGGDDVYASDTPWILGAARGLNEAPAFALFLDAAGDDRYAANGPALGVGWDGFGFAFDLGGNDFYETAARGLGSASTSKSTGLALGVFADRFGNDNYTSGTGFASLNTVAEARSTTALFLDGGGFNNYTGTCAPDVARSCFATPRPAEGGELVGTVVFADLGANHAKKYPRAGDPNNGPSRGGSAGSTAAEIPAGLQQALTEGGTPPPTGYAYPNPDRTYAVVTNPAIVNLLDSDGDGLFDQIDPSPGRRSGIDDSDGDGIPDEAEYLAGTSPYDPGSRPLYAVPDDSSTSGLLVDLPGLLAIGAAGTESRFDATYRLAIDLGLDDADVYRGDVAAAALDPQTSATSVANGKNAYQETRTALPVSINLDFGGNDAYTPANRNLSLAVARGYGLALLVDYGGDDRYDVDGRGLASAAGAGAFAFMIDVAGDDRYDAPYGNALAYALGGGQAFFVDLAGSDRYLAPTQGHVLITTTGGSQSIFLDRDGDDAYDVGPLADVQVTAAIARGHASGTATTAAASVAATFLDLGGRDRYQEWNANLKAAEVARFSQDNVIRFRPLDNGPQSVYATFIDTSAGSNADGNAPTGLDVLETVADTDSGSAADEPIAGPGFFLRLPRFGLAIGTTDGSTWDHGQDYALSIDLGGDDRYTGRVGASSPTFSTSLHVDVGGSDEYVFAGGTMISQWRSLATGRVAGATGQTPQPAPVCGTNYCDAFVGSAHGAGVLGVGVLRDGGGRDVFDARVTSPPCAPCARMAPIYGVFQGAGLLGVGILSTSGRSTFTARAGPLEPVDPTVTVVPSAWTHAQGAGVLGFGLLASDAATSRDEYLLETLNVDAQARTSGQGVGYGGVGVLIDAGGDNRLRANRSAQGAGFSVNSLPGSGALVFAGVGNDDLAAVAEAQGHGGTGSLGLLIDADGDDRRLLASTLVGGRGQGFGGLNGVGLLVDNRGNDVYSSSHEGSIDLAQGAMAGGFGIFLDFAGDDQYDAAGGAQGYASTGSGSAFFLDRFGNDSYRLRDTSTNNGHGRAATSATGSSAFFLDLGGQDRYSAGTPAGNRMSWGDASRQIGLDSHDADDQWSKGSSWLFVALRLGGLAPVFDLRDAANSAAATIPLASTVTLRMRPTTTTNAALASLALALVDRVEFYVENQSVGRGVPSASGFTLSWTPGVLGEDDWPVHADGFRHFVATLHQRAGTPTAADEVTGRRAAVDTLPFTTTIRRVAVDGPPIARVPVVAQNVSSAHDAQVPIRLRVDRDLENNLCLACDATLLPGPDSWANLSTPRPPFDGVESTCDAGCTGVFPVALRAGARVYLTWGPAPAPVGRLVEGYDVVRVGNAEDVHLGFVDARASLRFVDATPPPFATYRVDTLYAELAGVSIARSDPVDPMVTGPGPATGLAFAAEAQTVRLAWAPVEGAVQYQVERAPASAPNAFAPIAHPTEPEYLDSTVGLDQQFYYRVRPVDASGVTSQVPAESVLVRASPGHVVTLALQNATATKTIVEGLPLPGMTDHNLVWDAGRHRVNDGAYRLVATQRDGSKRATSASADVFVDGTAPRTTWNATNWLNLDHAADLGIIVPFVTRDDGTGIVETTTSYRVGDLPWTIGPDVTVDDAGENKILYGEALILGAGHMDTIEVVVSSLDRVGNVEHVDQSLPWSPASRHASDGVPFAIAGKGVRRYQIDLRAPVLSSSPIEATLRPGEELPITIRVSESGSGLEFVRAEIGIGAPVSLQPNGNDRTGVWTAVEPGQHLVVIRARDRAGNEVTLNAGLVTVDAEPPTVTQAAIEFPGGAMAARPGAKGRLVVRAADDYTRPEALSLVADLSNLTSTVNGALAYDRIRGTYASEEFVVDRIPDGTAIVPIRLTDPAGNLRVHFLEVLVDGAPIRAGPASVVATGSDWAVIRWATDSTARGAVEYGLRAEQRVRTPNGAEGSTHEINVTGLRPETEYVARAFSITRSGLETPSEFFTFKTGAALQVELTPIAGFPASNGEAEVRVRVLDYMGSLARGAPAVEVTLLPKRGPARLVAEVVGARATELTLTIPDVRDGDYEIVARARSADGRGESARIAYTLDRVAPLIVAPADPVGTPGGILAFRVDERGSGLAPGSIKWMLNEEACAATWREGTVSCRIPETVKGTRLDLRLEMADKAGNVAVLDTPLRLDRAVAAFVETRLVGENDPHVQSGDRARLVAVLGGATVRAVTADFSAMGGPSRLPLLQGLDKATWTGYWPVPETYTSTRIRAKITAESASGATTTVEVEGTVDHAAPVILESGVVPGVSTADLAILADEPVRLFATAGGRTVSTESYESRSTLRVTGLAPAASTPIQIQVVDRSGRTSMIAIEVATEPDTTAPTAVASLEALALGDGRILLRWEPATDDVGVARHEVVRVMDGRREPIGGDHASRSLVDHVEGSGDVLYEVRALDASGNAGPLTTASITPIASVSLERGSVEPAVAGPGPFRFRVFAPGGYNSDLAVAVAVDGVKHPMRTRSESCAEGCWYEAIVDVGVETLASGPHQFTFTARLGQVESGWSTLAGPVVVAGLPPASLATLASATSATTPLPFLVPMALAVSAWLTVVLRRRVRS